MNERIKELAIEAGYLPDMFGVGHWDMPECKKFAELIIQECALTLESITVPVLDYNPSFDNGYNKALLNGSAVIKKHFGVKQ
jgi:hypothetical protein